MTDYGTALTGRLAALGLSRNALARALGHRGASQVSRWCAGKASPRPKAQRAIEAALAALTDPQPEILGPETREDAPGATIPPGEVSYHPPLVVQRYVVEGG